MRRAINDLVGNDLEWAGHESARFHRRIGDLRWISSINRDVEATQPAGSANGNPL
jgi:hypothetical protein